MKHVAMYQQVCEHVDHLRRSRYGLAQQKNDDHQRLRPDAPASQMVCRRVGGFASFVSYSHSENWISINQLTYHPQVVISGRATQCRRFFTVALPNKRPIDQGDT